MYFYLSFDIDTAMNDTNSRLYPFALVASFIAGCCKPWSTGLLTKREIERFTFILYTSRCCWACCCRRQSCRVACYRHVSGSHLLPDKAWLDAQSHHSCGAACRLTCRSWDPTKTILRYVPEIRNHICHVRQENLQPAYVFGDTKHRLPFGAETCLCNTSNWVV